MRSYQIFSYSKNSPHMDSQGSSPHSLEPATCPYPEPYQSSPCPSSYFLTSGSLSLQHGAFSGSEWKNGLQIWQLAVNILNKQ